MELKPKDLSKINFKFFRNVILIFDRIFFGMILVLAMSLLVATFLPKRLYEISSEILNNFKIGIGSVVRYNLDIISANSINIKSASLALIFTVILIIIVIYFITHNLKLIFDTLAEKNPFAEKNSKRIAYIGIFLIVLSALENLPETVMLTILNKQINLNDIEIIYSMDDGLILSGILVIILATVFGYGTFLQNEYDSTL
ncbi:MAG: hypothetical protein K0Q49_2131 [Haloplasmataceae bacterium]|jgi:hypothetical protein|nr:hypothetical protein [Haloplasmataceae bacterium]